MQKLLLTLFGLVLVGAPAGAGVLVDPGGVIESIVADPTRNVFYASLETNEIVVVTTGGSVSNRVTVSGDPDALAVARNGSALYVALEDSHDVAVYDLPGLTFRATWDLSAASTGPTGLAEKAGRLYAVSNDGLAIVDTTNGTELFFGQPPGGPGGSYFYSSGAVLSPDGKRLYSLNTGLSPASLFVFDVSTEAPVYVGEDCCHGCIGSNGRQVALSPDGRRAYVAAGAPYYVQVLSTVPLLHPEGAAGTGPYPSAVAVSANGARLYVGYGDSEFAVVRTSDWLPYHVGTLQDGLAAKGLALASNQTTLAAVLEYQGFEPNRIELVDVASPVANRGGVRVRPLDQPTGVPVGWAYLDVSPNPSGGTSTYVEVREGRLGRTFVAPGAVDIDLTATGHVAQSFARTVAAGSWTDLGDVQLTRNGTVPSVADVCVSPAAFVGGTTSVEVHGRGFLPGLLFDSTDSGVVVDSFELVDWATIRATLSVDPAETPGLRYAARVTNPGGDVEVGQLLLKDSLFADGFETGDATRWSLSVP